MPVQDLQAPFWEQLDGDRVAPLPRARPLHRWGRRDNWAKQAPAFMQILLYQSGQAPQSLATPTPTRRHLYPGSFSPLTCPLFPLLSPISPGTPSLAVSFFTLSLPFFCSFLRSRPRKWATTPEISRLTEGGQKEPVGRGAPHLQLQLRLWPLHLPSQGPLSPASAVPGSQ